MPKRFAAFRFATPLIAFAIALFAFSAPASAENFDVNVSFTITGSIQGLKV